MHMNASVNALKACKYYYFLVHFADICAFIYVHIVNFI